MSYKYLEDGTKFSAEEINDRTEAAAESVNSLDSNALAFGALRHEHLPQLIGPSGYAAGNFKSFVSNRNALFDPVASAPFLYVDGVLPVNVTYGTPMSFEDRDVDAFIVLFNANVRRFMLKRGGAYFDLSDIQHEKNEDFLSAVFRIYVDLEVEGLGDWTLTFAHTARAVSPGFTFFGTTAPAGFINREPGSAFHTDDNSFQDMAIRTVLRPSDFIEPIYGDTSDESLISNIKVKKVGVVVNARNIHSTDDEVLSGDIAVEVTKMNLTVIPIQASVTSVGV